MQSFTLQNVLPGEYRINVFALREHFIQSVRLGQADVSSRNHPFGPLLNRSKFCEHQRRRIDGFFNPRQGSQAEQGIQAVLIPDRSVRGATFTSSLQAIKRTLHHGHDSPGDYNCSHGKTSNPVNTTILISSKI